MAIRIPISISALVGRIQKSTAEAQSSTHSTRNQLNQHINNNAELGIGHAVSYTNGLLVDLIGPAIARILAFFAANPDWGWDPDAITASLDLQIEPVELSGFTVNVDWGWLS